MKTGKLDLLGFTLGFVVLFITGALISEAVLRLPTAQAAGSTVAPGQLTRASSPPPFVSTIAFGGYLPATIAVATSATQRTPSKPGTVTTFEFVGVAAGTGLGGTVTLTAQQGATTLCSLSVPCPLLGGAAVSNVACNATYTAGTAIRISWINNACLVLPAGNVVITATE